LLGTEPGFEVVATVEDGLEAVEAADLQGPDVVVMDCRTPRMDGFEATRIIKERQSATGVVLLTAFADGRRQAMAAGADAFLLKDCTPEELIEAIRRAGTPRPAL
jgi:CheY-like chemotaxis protein